MYLGSTPGPASKFFPFLVFTDPRSEYNPGWLSVARVAKLVDARDLIRLSTRMETPGVNGVKFGGTSACDGGGNPELSLEFNVCGRASEQQASPYNIRSQESVET